MANYQKRILFSRNSDFKNRTLLDRLIFFYLRLRGLFKDHETTVIYEEKKLLEIKWMNRSNFRNFYLGELNLFTNLYFKNGYINMGT